MMQHPRLTIRGVKARAVDAPLANPIRTAVGEVPSAPLVLLDIATEEGVTGRSYLFAYTPVTLRCFLMYSRITASSRPTVETKYPLAQKCWPVKLRFRSP